MTLFTLENYLEVAEDFLPRRSAAAKAIVGEGIDECATVEAAGVVFYHNILAVPIHSCG